MSSTPCALVPRSQNRRTDMKTNPIIAAVSAVAVTIMLSACGTGATSERHAAHDTTTSATTVAPALVNRPAELNDELVAVHGARLRLHCVGTGPTTVVLIAGFTSGRETWTAVEPTVSQNTRVCSY